MVHSVYARFTRYLYNFKTYSLVSLIHSAHVDVDALLLCIYIQIMCDSRRHITAKYATTRVLYMRRCLPKDSRRLTTSLCGFRGHCSCAPNHLHVRCIIIHLCLLHETQFDDTIVIGFHARIVCGWLCSHSNGSRRLATSQDPNREPINSRHTRTQSSAGCAKD